MHQKSRIDTKKSLFIKWGAQVNIQGMIGKCCFNIDIFKLLNNYFGHGYHLFALNQAGYTGIRPITTYMVNV